jgi:hypothetical protein
MTADEAIPYVAHVLDTALSPDHAVEDIGPGTWLIGWQCGFEPMFVAVVATYTEAVDASDAEDIAADYLEEIGWFADERTDADYFIRVSE